MGGPGTDVGDDVADQRQVLHDHRVACVPVHAVPLVDLREYRPVRGPLPSVGTTSTGLLVAGVYAEDRAVPSARRPHPCDAVRGDVPRAAVRMYRLAIA
ncbi:hypothetical protein GCM10017712_29410 [Curtobacterium citreum]